MAQGKRAEIDIEEIKDFAARQWPITAIAAHYRISKKTIYRKYGSIIEENRHLGVVSLLDAAWFQAKAGKWEPLKYLLDRFLPQYIPQAPAPVQVNIEQQNVQNNLSLAQPPISNEAGLELVKALLAKP